MEIFCFDYKKNTKFIFCNYLVYKLICQIFILFTMKYVKNFLLSAFLFLSTVCFSQQSGNPLANTEWNGIANIPSPEEITFKFSNDTIDLIFSGNVAEKMKYTLKDKETIRLFKIDGNSPCDSAEEGSYKFVIKK